MSTVTMELVYDAPLTEVRAMLFDPAFRETVLERQKVARGSVSVEGDTIRVQQVQHSAGLPSFATKIVGSEIEIIRVEQWSGDDAVLEFSIPGKPGEIHGTSRLTERDGSTVQTVDLEISVRIPLVGGKLAGLVATILTKALDKEQEAGTEWLAERA
jgi:hypothetical protein